MERHADRTCSGNFDSRVVSHFVVVVLYGFILVPRCSSGVNACWCLFKGTLMDNILQLLLVILYKYLLLFLPMTFKIAVQCFFDSPFLESRGSR